MDVRRTVCCILLLGAMAITAISCYQPQASPSADSSGRTSINETPVAAKPEADSAPSRSPVELAPARLGDTYAHQPLATGEPGMNTFTAPGAGSSTKLDRTYPGAPPQVPHAVDGLAITKDSNTCVSCHTTGVQLGEGHVATKIPESHYTNLQTGERQTILVGRRYNCLQCHVPQASAEALVDN